MESTKSDNLDQNNQLRSAFTVSSLYTLPKMDNSIENSRFKYTFLITRSRSSSSSTHAEYPIRKLLIIYLMIFILLVWKSNYGAFLFSAPNL